MTSSVFDPTRIDDAPAAAIVRTHHSGTFNEIDLTYDVLAGEFVLFDDDQQPAATMFSTAYVRTDVGDSTARPVLFLFNGGPGASSSPLHLGIGPVRRPPDDPEGPLVQHPQSVIDAVDMVYIDPVGTGYSRLYYEGAGTAYWGINEDADAVLLFMEDWLRRNGRVQSPVFVMGESYGGTRAVALLARSRNIRFCGALLLSPALDYSASRAVVGNNLPYIFLLPSMAATAAYHGVTDRAGRSYTEIFEQAAQYAIGEYALALLQGNGLDMERRQSVATQVVRLTGLERADVLEHDLRIDAATFSDLLLKDKGLRTGRLDARISGPIEEYRDKRPPFNDPGMSASRGGRSTGELLHEYFSTVLGTEIDRPYRTLNLDANAQWNFGHKDDRRMYFSVAPLLRDAMLENEELKVFVGGGLFDLGTAVMAASYITQQIGIPAERFFAFTYEGGHAVFEHEESRIKLGHDIRAFVAVALQ